MESRGSFNYFVNLGGSYLKVWIWGFTFHVIKYIHLQTIGMQVQNTNKVQNKHGVKLICLHVSKCVSWLVLMMSGVDLISHDKWFFYHFMPLETIELATNSYQLILKHVIMIMCWHLFFYASGLSLSTSCLFFMSNFLSIIFFCCVFYSCLQVTILQMVGWGGRKGWGFIISYVTSNLLKNVYYLALGLTSPTKPLAFYTS